MSAIAGLWSRTGDVDPDMLRRMISVFAFCGETRSDSWTDHAIGLGRVLASFLPEDIYDQQPLWNADRTVCMVADVRLDNRADLILALRLSDAPNLSDSAILFAAFLQWGEDLLQHVLGGFAFAVWIPGRKELFLARDHSGERPLHYHVTNNLFAWATMPKGLLVLPAVSGELEEGQVADWLALLAPEEHDKERTFFKGVKRLPPGHSLKVTPQGCVSRRYWHPSDAKPTRLKNNAEYAEALLEIFERAVAARLRTTRTVGTELSSGFDSGSVTACAARLLSLEGKGLHSFTAVPRPEYNEVYVAKLQPREGAGAAEVAAMYPNISHHLVDSKGQDLFRLIRTWSDAMDMPVRNVTNFPWISAIFDQARERNVGVMLTGVMGNATISWGSWNPLGSLFRQGRWLELLDTVRDLRRNRWIGIKRATAYSLHGFLPKGLDQWLRPRTTADSSSIEAHPDLIRKYDLTARMARQFSEVPLDIAQQRRWQFEFVDCGPVNAAVRAITGMDYRDPTSDKRVWEFCYSIPPEQYVAEGHWRSLLRRAMKDRLPATTLERRDIGQQGADWYVTLGEALPALQAELNGLKSSSQVAKTVDLGRMQGLLDTWPSSGFEQDEVELNWDLGLTRGISMGDFMRRREAQAQPDVADQSPEVATSATDSLPALPASPA